MNRSLQLSVEHTDAFDFDADVLVLKHAQGLFGLDRAVHERLKQAGITVELPEVDEDAIVDTGGTLRVAQVLFVGVKPLGQFGYPEIRDFARQALVALTRRGLPARHVAFTVHGPGYGLDEAEAFESAVAGIAQAVSEGAIPRTLEAIAFVESDRGRAERLSRSLARLIPTGRLPIDGVRSKQGLTAASQETLRTAGYTSADKPHVFVAMPFAAEMDDIYHYGIQGAANTAGFLCERADLSVFTGDVMDWVKSRIGSAALVVADLTTANPNVYLEVGYAWGCQVPTVLLAKDASDLKFDVMGQRCLVYKSIKQLEESLRQELQGLAARTPRG